MDNQNQNETAQQAPRKRKTKEMKPCQVLARNVGSPASGFAGWNKVDERPDLPAARKLVREYLASHPNQEVLIIRAWGPFRVVKREVSSIREV